MTVINTNMASQVAANALKRNSRDSSQAMQRLATGKRINSAKDDAAGLAISSKMTSQILGTAQAVRNANNAISMIQTADGATEEIGNMLQRMRELGVQYSNGTNTSADQANINVEFKELATEIERVADNTQWNGMNILKGINTDGDVTYQIGANANQTITVNFADFELAAGATSYSDGSSAGGVYGADLSGMIASSASITAATSGITTTLDTAIAGVNTQRAKYGAAINRLDYAADNLTNISQNATASRSRITDADYAKETAELARTAIIQQAATAMLVQANAQPALVISLLNAY
jgi:flagellin